MNLTKYLCSAIIITLFVSCAQDAPKGKTQAEVLYKEAQQFIKDGRFILANEKLNMLRSQHPYSFYATPAELLQADILYMQENFVEAAAAYILFRDFHPRHKRMPYVVFRIAESYYKQIPDTYDRDLSPAVEAIKYYQEVLQRYPTSEFADGANKKIVESQLKIDLKEKYIADFYFKTKVYDAAIFRYKGILEQIKNSEILKHSQIRIVKAAWLSDNYQDCIRYAQQFLVSADEGMKSELVSTLDKCSRQLQKNKRGKDNA